METGANHNSLLHLAGGIIHSSTLISDIETALSAYPNFLRCRRSYLINMSYVHKVESGLVVMTDGNCVLLSVRRFAKIKKQIMDYLHSRMRKGL